MENEKMKELTEEELEKIAGGIANADGTFTCYWCGEVFQEKAVYTKHYISCPKNPYRRGA